MYNGVSEPAVPIRLLDVTQTSAGVFMYNGRSKPATPLLASASGGSSYAKGRGIAQALAPLLTALCNFDV